MKILLILSIFVFGCVIAERIALFFISPDQFYFENKYLKLMGGVSFVVFRTMFCFCCFKIITTAVVEFFEYFKVL